MSEREQPEWRHGFRDVSAEIEALEADLERSTRDLIDVLVDEGRSGSRLRIDTAAGSIEGEIEHVGTDLVRVDLGTSLVDLAVSSAVTVAVVRRGTEVRRVSRGHPSSILALGRELAQSAARVEIGRVTGAAIVGTLIAAGGSHLELETATGPTFVPTAAVVWIRQLDRTDR